MQCLKNTPHSRRIYIGAIIPILFALAAESSSARRDEEQSQARLMTSGKLKQAPSLEHEFSFSLKLSSQVEVFSFDDPVFYIGSFLFYTREHSLHYNTPPNHAFLSGGHFLFWSLSHLIKQEQVLNFHYFI